MNESSKKSKRLLGAAFGLVAAVAFALSGSVDSVVFSFISCLLGVISVNFVYQCGRYDPLPPTEDESEAA
jgi:hypothetical protein